MDYRKRLQEYEKRYDARKRKREGLSKDSLLAYNGDELMKMKFPRPRDGDTWGRWKFVQKNLTLFYEPGKEVHTDWYEVDLEECLTSAAVLDWIAQIASKIWATNDCIGNLVRALNDLLNPQSNLCSFGLGGTESKRLSSKELKQLLLKEIR